MFLLLGLNLVCSLQINMYRIKILKSLCQKRCKKIKNVRLSQAVQKTRCKDNNSYKNPSIIALSYLESVFVFCIHSLQMFGFFSSTHLSFLLLHIAGEFLSQYGWALLLVTAVMYLIIQAISKKRSNRRDSGQAPPSQRGRYHLFYLSM